MRIRQIGNSTHKRRVMRFGLRSLFVVLTMTALVGGLIAWGRNLYYVQLRTVDAALAEYPEIGSVWLCTNPDVTLEVEELYFSRFDQLGLTFGITGIDGATKSEICKKIEHALREKRPVSRPRYAVQHR